MLRGVLISHVGEKTDVFVENWVVLLDDNSSGRLVEDVCDDQKNIQVHHERYSVDDDYVVVNFVVLFAKVDEIDHVFRDPDTRPENNAHDLEYDRTHVQVFLQVRYHLHNRNQLVEGHGD